MSFFETHATELVGYLAMLVLLISFLMRKIKLLSKIEDLVQSKINNNQKYVF